MGINMTAGLNFTKAREGLSKLGYKSFECEQILCEIAKSNSIVIKKEMDQFRALKLSDFTNQEAFDDYAEEVQELQHIAALKFTLATKNIRGRINIFDYECIERLANYAHVSWSHWMDYLFSKSLVNPDGSITIPKESVERWKRQSNTEYMHLSNEEKESDRKEARLMIKQVNESNCVILEEVI